MEIDAAFKADAQFADACDLLITETRSPTFSRRLDLRTQWLDALPQRDRDLFVPCHGPVLPPWR
ncbi:hypothetical protein XpopCFBP1817_09025 [Xanthomonas populi]|uniref:Uncharacterized protein n=1 Tax=Xanthomonas populi TaxID=53414 RepID=A0A2S7EQ72_9XANT|nr:hypothetical protein XpopCFBP1817_09025 [Xanthomonas populi]